MSQQQHTQEPVAVLDEAMQQASHNGFMSLWQSYCDQKETISEMRDRIAELEKQRDELLAAVEKFISSYRTGGPILPGVLENAIASVKEKA